jgi:uncharacterized repeat protein (TIGR01451 family)
MKHIFTFCIVLFSIGVKAQTNYTVYPIPYNPDPFVSNNVAPNTQIDDSYSSPIPIGFTFNYFGVDYTQALISTNGYISFDLNLANDFSPWNIDAPIANLGGQGLTNSIFAPWQDINPANGGMIYYSINGTAPFRRFVVSFYQTPMFSCYSILFSQQIILFETTNIIETHILDKPLCSTWNSGYAIHGLVDASGANTVLVPGRDYPNVWTANYDSWRFDPSGNVFINNVVTGKVFQDLNGNCIPDANELGIANRPILANGGDFYTYTDADGNYNLHVDTGTYTISEIPPLYYAVSCPSTGVYTLNFPAQFDTSYNNNFSDSILFYCSDLMVDIGTTNMSSCMTEWVGINYCNIGTVAETAALINFTLNDSIQILNLPANIVNLGANNYQVAVGNLNPGQCGNIAFQVQIGCDSVGTVYCMQANISGAVAYDCDTVNNTSTDCHSLIGSFDPNDLQVAAQNYLQEGYVMADDIDDNDELTYLIRFQNTGNDTAYNVKIKDMIPAELNAATILPGAASHNYNWLVLNGELIIDFLMINLPDSFTNEPNSHGFVKFKIKQNSGNMPGTVITNQAGIYFDFNSPVITNQTFNTIPLATGIAAQAKDIKFMPNPVNDLLQLVLPFENIGNTSIEVIDILGKGIQQQRLENKVSTLDCSSLSKGMYMARIMHNGAVYTQFKFVKE